MLDLELIMQQIEEKQVEELTTKELKDNGLNKYYIKKAVDLGKLEKIKKGIFGLINLSNASSKMIIKALIKL